MSTEIDYASYGPIEMDPEIRAEWARTLRKDRLSQGFGYLTSLRKRGKRKHCCLGVLCMLAVKAGVIPRGRKDEYGEELVYGESGQTQYLPREVMQWAGLAERDPEVPRMEAPENGFPETLAGLNDNMVKFRDIADVIDGGAGRDS